jgi:hypothetical protein
MVCTPLKNSRRKNNLKTECNLDRMATNDQGLSKYVTLVSSDGFEFVVLREAACISGAIKRMLDPKSTPFTPSKELAIPQSIRLIALFTGSFAESVDGRCTFEEIKYVYSIPPSYGQRERAVNDDQNTI